MITDLSVIVKEWAYRVHNGKPNPNNSAHLYQLSELLIEKKWPFEVIDELLQNLNEVDIVKNKKSGNVYSVQNHNPDTQDLVKKDASPEDVKKVDKDDDEKDIGKRVIAGKDKTLQKVDSETEKQIFDSDLSPDEDEFENRNKDFGGKDITNPPPPYKLPEELKNLSPKVPKKYIQMIERMVNTQRVDDFKPPISHFIDERGAGRISAQAGEIMTLATVGMTDEQAELFFNSMNEHLQNPDRPIKQIIDKTWVKAAINNRKAIFNRLKKKYPNINLPEDVQHSAWDTKTDVEGLGLSEYEKNKGFSTDVYMKINTPDGVILDEISLKKDKNVNFLNSGAGKFSEWDSDLPDEINQIYYRKNQRKNLVEGVGKLLQDKMKTDKKLREAYEATKAGKGSRAKSKILRNALDELAKSGNTEAQKVLDKMNRNRAEFERKSVEAITKDPLKAGMLKEIASEFPLKGVSDEEESMAIGDMSLDKVTMKEIFGTDNYDDIKENLVAETGEDGKPYLGYKASVADEVIPIAQIKIREDGTNYGGQFKFEMILHKDFAKRLKSANEIVYGEE
jgi:hypothetical protein